MVFSGAVVSDHGEGGGGMTRINQNCPRKKEGSTMKLWYPLRDEKHHVQIRGYRAVYGQHRNTVEND